MNKNSEKIYLCPGETDNLSGHFTSYDLMTHDCHSDDFKEFYPFAADALVELFSDCKPVCIHSYFLEKHAKKRWLLPNQPAVFQPNQVVENLSAYIAAHDLDWAYCHMESSAKSKFSTCDQKEFCVAAPNVNRHFIERNFDPDSGILLVGYLPQFFDGTDDVQKMAEDFVGAAGQSRHFAVTAFMAEDHAMIRLCLNPCQYPVEQLVSRIRAVAEKHNKILEVSI